MILHALRGDAEASHAVARELMDDVRQLYPPSHRRVHKSEVLLFVHLHAHEARQRISYSCGTHSTSACSAPSQSPARSR